MEQKEDLVYHKVENECGQLLIIKASGLEEEELECDIVSKVAQLNQLSVVVITPRDRAHLKDLMKRSGGEFKFIYLSAHGDSKCMGDDLTWSVKWSKVGKYVCNTGLMAKDCILFLSCCQGGLNVVAYKLFYECDTLKFIVGPPSKPTPWDTSVSFHMFLYGHFSRGYDAVVSSEKIKCGTELRFTTFDRMDVMTHYGYQRYKERMKSRKKRKEEKSAPSSVKEVRTPPFPLEAAPERVTQ